MKTFKYFAPDNLDSAFESLRSGGSSSKVFAGGTDLLVEMKKNSISPAELIDIKRIPGLGNITLKADNALEIGPLVTISELAGHSKIARLFPALNQAALSIGSAQTRNKATIGGNICRAAPSGDMAPALLIYEAKVVLSGFTGSREVDLNEFFIGPGHTVVGSNEILTNILVPSLNETTSSLYIKRGRRSSVDLAVTGAAVLIEWQEDTKAVKECRIALASVAPRPIRVRKAESLLKDQEATPELIEQCARVASNESKPISDVYGSEWYKRELVGALVSQCLRKIVELRK